MLSSTIIFFPFFSFLPERSDFPPLNPKTINWHSICVLWQWFHKVLLSVLTFGRSPRITHSLNLPQTKHPNKSTTIPHVLGAIVVTKWGAKFELAGECVRAVSRCHPRNRLSRRRRRAAANLHFSLLAIFCTSIVKFGKIEQLATICFG